MFYTIIGNDGAQYGPIPEDHLRQWIAEGRLNARSRAKSENDAEFRPLGAFPEFAGAFPQQETPQPSAPSAAASAAELLAGDYHLSIGDCIAGGWNVVKGNFWPCVGVNFLVMLILGVANQVPGLFTRPAMNRMIVQHDFSAGRIFLIGSISILAAPVYTVLTAGLYVYFLKLIRGQNPSVGDAFSGFGPSLLQLALLAWVQGGLVVIGFLFCFFPGLYLCVAWLFAVPLVIDQKMGFWEALELSRKMVAKNWFLLFGFLIVYSLVVAAGVMACCVGILVTMPIGLAALMCAYQSIFCRSEPEG